MTPLQLKLIMRPHYYYRFFRTRRRSHYRGFSVHDYFSGLMIFRSAVYSSYKLHVRLQRI